MRLMTPYAAVNYIRNGIGYENYLKEYAAYRKLKPEELISRFWMSFRRAPGEFSDTIGRLVSIIWKNIRKTAGRTKQEKTDDGDAVVRLQRLHSSKGLEFPGGVYSGYQ